MSPEIRREVSASSDFLERVDYFFGEGFEVLPSAHEILMREVVPYVFEAFREGWQDMPWVMPSESRFRFYEFRSDEVPKMFFIAELKSVHAPDPFHLIEHIELTDLIVEFGSQPLEDPEEPAPDR